MAFTPVPGLSQVKAWSSEYLEQAAAQGSATATTWDDAYTEAFRPACSRGVGRTELQVLSCLRSVMLLS